MSVQINGSDGRIISTHADHSGNVSIGGTLTYEDVTNIDSVGLVTARSGIEIGARPGVAASISVDGNMIISGISTFGDDITFTGATSGRDVVFDTSLNQIRAQDNAKLCAGSSSDLEIYHTGSGAYIQNKTGSLFIGCNFDDDDGGDIRIQPKYGENSIVAYDDGPVELYYDNSRVFETDSASVKIRDNIKAKFGTGDDIQLYHDGSNSYFLNSTGFLNIKTTGGGAHYIDADDQYFRTSGGENLVQMRGDGAVSLYYDNVSHLETHPSGAQVKNTGADTSLFITGSEGYSAQIQFLADDGDDYADYSRIYKDQDGGDLHIQNYASGSWEDNIVFNNNGSVELYHDNDKVFETIDYGINAGNNTSIYENSAHNIGIIRHADMHHAILFRAESNADGSSLTNTNTTTFREYGAFQFMTGAINMTTKFTIFQNGNATLSGTLTQGSDVRLKTDVVGITSALSKVNQIRGVEYKWNSVAEDNCGIRNREDGVKEIGVIADEIESIIPQVVKSDNVKSIDGTEYKSVAYDRLTPILIEAVKELSAEVDALKAEIAALKSN